MPKPDIGELMKDKGKLMLVTQSPISTKQVLKIFQRTPAEHIKRRTGKGGGVWEYVTATYVKKVLNFVFGWLWDFQIIDKGREGNIVWVQGRLTIKNAKLVPIVIKEQFGRAEIKFRKDKIEMLDYGNDLKAAASDALKKCAAELGIASDVYGKEEFREIGLDPGEPTKAPVKDAKTPTTDRFSNALKMIGAQNDPKELKDWQRKIKATRAFTVEQKEQLLNRINAKLPA